MSYLKPKLFSVIGSYNKETFIKDLVAGIVVAIIALPLSIALAIASGVGPNEGLYTAIVAGFAISFFGGNRVQISGPTAAFSTIVASIVMKDGMEVLALATIFAGICLIIFGILKLGKYILYIPNTIVTGFTAGIAVTIAIGQIKDFCGIQYLDGAKPISCVEKVMAFANNIGTFNFYALLIGLLSLAVLIVIPKILPKVPASLIAILVSTFVVIIFNVKVFNINDLYTISNKPMTFHAPNLSLLGNKSIYINGFIIAVLAGIESLLATVVSDKMINDKSNENAELMAQGIGNILSVLFGGIPATGAIARTTANFKNGGKTPIAGMIHAICLFFILIGLMKYVGLIPMPTIASLLFIVAYNMSQVKEISGYIKKGNIYELIVLFVCFALTILYNLVIGIAVSLVIYFILSKLKVNKM